MKNFYVVMFKDWSDQDPRYAHLPDMKDVARYIQDMRRTTTLPEFQVLGVFKMVSAELNGYEKLGLKKLLQTSPVCQKPTKH